MTALVVLVVSTLYLALLVLLLPVKAAPAPPTFANLVYSKSTFVNPYETISTSFDIYYNGDKGHILENTSTPNGHYGTLTRYDLKAVYYLSAVNGKPFCKTQLLPAPYVPPLPLPPPGANLKYYHFAGESVVAGKAVNVFRVTIGRYIITKMFAVEDGTPMASYDATSDGISQIFYEFHNNTAPPSSVFDVPEACKQQEQGGGLPRYGFYGEGVERQKGHSLRTSMFEHPTLQTQKNFFESHSIGRPELPHAVHKETTEKAPFAYKPRVKKIPGNVDNRRFATAIRTQGPCGGCWAFSSVAATEVAYNLAHNITSNKTYSAWFSVQSVIDCAHGNLNGTALIEAKGCNGGWPSVAMDLITRNGIVREADYRYDMCTGETCKELPSTVPRFFPLSSFLLARPRNVKQLLSAVVEHGAFVGIINMITTNIFYDGGIYNDPNCVPGLAHAVTIVGYGTEEEKGVKTDYWIIKNSFGEGWGEGGYIRMVRGVNMCGIEEYGFIPVSA